MLWQCLLFPWGTEGEQAKTEEEFPFSYGSCTHIVSNCITLTAKGWMNHSYRFCFPPFFLFLLYPLLCLCTVNSLLPCVSSDNELKFRCRVLQFGSLSFISWNPSTLRFHKKKKTKKNKTTTTTKTKTLKWRMMIAVIYTTFPVGKRKPEKNSGLCGIRTFDLCDTGAAL